MFKVEKKEAENFASVWTQKTLVILSPEAIQFATDFSNVVLNNFIGMCQKNATQAAIKAAEVQPKQIITEGI